MSEDRKTSTVAVYFSRSSVILGFAILFAAVMLSGMPLNHDCASILHSGELIIEGSVPFVDHIEVSFHITQYIHAVPAILSKYTGMDIPLVFHALVLLLILYSVIATNFFLKFLRDFSSETWRTLLVSSILVLSLHAARAGEFGQREHLFFLAYIPYFHCRLARYQNSKIPVFLSMFTGLTTGMFLLMKPHFFLLVLIVEVWMLFRTRHLRNLYSTEIFAAVSVILLYIVHFLILPGSGEYFSRWLPFIAKNYDSSYSMPFVDMLRWNSSFWLLFLFAVLPVFFLLRSVFSKIRLYVESILFVCVASVLFFFVQHKGWFYHLLPARGFIYALYAIFYISFIKSERACAILSRMRIRISGISSAILIFLPVAGIYLFLAIGIFELAGTRYPLKDEFVELLNEYSEEGSCVAFLSTDIYPKYPTLIYADREPGTRYSTAFPIAFFYWNSEPDSISGLYYRKPENMSEEESLFLLELGSDILANRPQLVIIQDTDECQACPSGFRIDEYLNYTGWQEEYMNNYNWLCELHDYQVYKLN